MLKLKIKHLNCLIGITNFTEVAFNLFRIDKDKIGEMSVKIQFNNEETWTKALKYMLTNLKFLLVWLAKVQDRSPSFIRIYCNKPNSSFFIFCFPILPKLEASRNREKKVLILKNTT